MRFWDSSAVVPLLVREASSETIEVLYREDYDVTVWWGSEVECASAITRRERSGGLRPDRAKAALDRLRAFAAAWREIDPSAEIRKGAFRGVRAHRLRAGDAFQLAAALAGAEGDPGSLPFVCLDEDLAVAADREGFPVIGL